MLFLPKGYSPTPGNLSLVIRAAVNKGKNINSIRKVVKALKRKVTQPTIQAIADYWRAVRNSGYAANLAKATTKLGSLVKASRRKTSSLTRVGFIVPFYDPNADDEKQWGEYIDVPSNTSINEIYNIILAHVINIMMMYYDYTTMSNKQIKEIASNIQITSIEGI